jgi:serine/threonine-protein kinase
LPIIIDALAGLHAAHTLQDESGAELRLVHCDVSPENLLVGVDGTCRLTDFGVARKANRSIGATTKGKPGYVSPEQIAGQTFDHRADIFSMGVVLWNSLTGQKLFSGASIEETLEQVCTKEIPAPSAIGIVSSPPKLDRVVLRALSREPSERFSTADDMLTALREIELPIGELATTREIAAWVREVAGGELTQRRLAILDASRRPTLPPESPNAEGIEEPPFSVAVPSLSLSASEPPDGDSRTMALKIEGGKSTRIVLWIAAVLAIAAIVVTLTYPRALARYFNLNTEPVISQGGVRVNVDQLPVVASSLAPAGPVASAPLVSPPQKTPSNISSEISQPVQSPEKLRQNQK